MAIAATVHLRTEKYTKSRETKSKSSFKNVYDKLENAIEKQEVEPPIPKWLELAWDQTNNLKMQQSVEFIQQQKNVNHREQRKTSIK